MSAPTLTQRRRQFALASVSGLVLTGAALVLVNALSQWGSLRLDLTRQGAYSLSPSSRRLVKSLDDRVVIKAYFSDSLPQPYSTYERYVRDLLVEYRSASKGRVRFEFVLPNPAKDFEAAAQDAHLLPMQFEEVGSDKLQIRRGFMGLVLYYRDKNEVIPVVRDIRQLEYEMTSKIARMASQKKKVIAYTTGHGEMDWLGPRSRIAAELEPLYEFRPLNLAPATTAPLQADAVLVVGPKRAFDASALWVIDQALMRGIPIAFFVDAKNVTPGRFQAAPLDTGLRDVLKHYGVQLGDRLVYDAQAETIGIQQNLGGFVFPLQINYPLIPLVTRLDTRSPVSRGLQTLALPFVTTVESQAQRPEGISFTPLLESTERSWLLPADAYSLIPDRIPKPLSDDPHGPYMLGAVVEGTFNSFFQGKPVPFPGASLIAVSPKTPVLVVGTSSLVDPSLPEFRGVEAFMTNVLGFLSKDDTLLGIRSKADLIRPLRPLTDRARQTVKLLAIFFPPLLAALFGLWRWRRRQNAKSVLSEAWAGESR